MGILRAGFHGTVGQPSAQVIDGSLKFQKANSTYLIRTPSSAGNRSVYTGSVWVKRTQFAPENNSNSNTHNHIIFSAGTDTANNIDNIRFYKNAGSDSNAIEYGAYPGSYNYLVITNAKFRDPSGWYNVVWNYDGTTAKIYINGVKQTDLDTNTQNGGSDGHFNNTVAHVIGRTPDLAYNGEFDGYMSQFYWIDGLSLGPGYFGFIDPLTNTWRPKKFRAEGTTINDGRSWSGTSSVSNNNSNANGAGSLANVFNGTQSGSSSHAYGFTTGAMDFTWTPNTPIPYNSEVRVWTGFSGGTVFLNGNEEVVSSQNNNWTTLVNGKSGSIQSVRFTVASGGGWWAGVEVDGVVLINSTTTNLDFGTNGFYLPMDNDDFHIDKSGKGNNWTKNNFSGTSINPDIVKDSPSGAVSGGQAQTGITTISSAPSNYCTLNPLNSSTGTLSDGNLKYSISAVGSTRGTLLPKSGKYYFEVNITTSGNPYLGIAGGGQSFTGGAGYIGPNAIACNTDGDIYVQTSSQTYPGHHTTIGTGLFMIAFDIDTKKIWWGKDGQWHKFDASSANLSSSSSRIEGGLDATDFSALDDSEGFTIMLGNSTSSNTTYECNFGQKPFKYTPPQGYLPLNSASVRPETVITRPDQFVGVATYIGDGGSSKLIKTGMKPDFVWVKCRSNDKWHALVDSVRGNGQTLFSNDDTASLSESHIPSFTSNGFTVADIDSGTTNQDTFTYASWSWKAGGKDGSNAFNVDDVGYASAAAAGLTGGSITPSGASVGTKQGFSIVKWTRDSGTDTISHGLSQAPDMIIQKSTSAEKRWQVGFNVLGWDKRMYLELTNAAEDSTSFGWSGNQGPTDTLLRTGGTSYVDGDMIAYCWHSVPGLQKFGQFTGNSAADGVHVELGFKPAILLIKNDNSTGDWIIWDNKRNLTNPLNKQLWPYTNSGTYGAYEQVGSDYPLDFLSSGFKMRTTDADMNDTGRTYVYAAWAESPTVNLFGGQSNAR